MTALSYAVDVVLLLTDLGETIISTTPFLICFMLKEFNDTL
jgi:hypothetical protein